MCVSVSVCVCVCMCVCVFVCVCVCVCDFCRTVCGDPNVSIILARLKLLYCRLSIKCV